MLDELFPPVDAPPPDPDTPRAVVSRTSIGDRIYRGILRTAGQSVMVIMGLIALFLLLRAGQALSKVGLSFLTEQRWQVGTNHFGIAAVLPDGIFIALVAMAIAIPVSLATALYISEYAPKVLRTPLIWLIDLMAAIPSIVYGLWGLFFLQPRIIGFCRWLAHHLDFIPLFKVRTGDFAASYTSSAFIAGVVVSLMVIPIITSLSREVFSQTPQSEREAAYALGSTRWGMVRTVVLPFGRGGMIGATMLGLGRALGETIAISLIISPIFTINFHVLEGGGISVPALIALHFPEAGDKELSALMAAGLVLFAITLLVNVLATIMINRSRSGASTAD